MVSRVGYEFFLTYFRFDPNASWYIGARADPAAAGHAGTGGLPPQYRVVYAFRMPQYDFVDERVTCIVGPDGTLLGFRGAPDCRADPEECRFSIDREKARQIAAEQGLEPGATEWRFHFHWSEPLESYVWAVTTTLEARKCESSTIDLDTTRLSYVWMETPPFPRCSGSSGRTVTIDANSEVVVGEESWFSS